MDFLDSFAGDFQSSKAESFLRQCEDITDWHTVFDCAAEQGVDGVLLQAMLDQGVMVPREVLSRYGGRLASQHFLHRQLKAIEGRVAKDFAKAGIRAVALHGPSLDERIGSIEVGMRAANQLSFLVSRRDYLKAAALLAEYDGALIHLRHTLPNGLSETQIEGLLRRAIRHETQTGDRLWILTPEDELVVLATDCQARDFGRLGWLYDLKLFIESHYDLEPDFVSARAEELGLSSVFKGILDLLGACLGVSLDDAGTSAGGWPSVSGGPPLSQRVAWQLADDVLAEAVSTSWGLRLWAKKSP